MNLYQVKFKTSAYERNVVAETASEAIHKAVVDLRKEHGDAYDAPREHDVTRVELLAEDIIV